MGGGASAAKGEKATPRNEASVEIDTAMLQNEGKRAVDMIEKIAREQEDLKSLVRSIRGEDRAAPAAEGKSKLKKVALLTAGGLAPCLSAAVGGLIQRYTDLLPEVEIICYKGGYKGLLLGDSIKVGSDVRSCAGDLLTWGGSPIGNSRVKLTNVKDCVKRGLVQEGQDPQKVAADQLVKDGVDVLHTIGGDDTNLAAADLAAFLKKNDYELKVIGLPKTIDNDVFPIKQTLGAWTAAEEGAKFFANVVNEQSASHRMLIVHEVMGRDCGYLTAATARNYRENLKSRATVPQLGLHFEKLDVHAVFIPEISIDIEAEAERLSKVMDAAEVVNIFVSEGAGVADIVKEMESRGEVLPRDAFGHIKLNEVNPGAWFAKRFSELVKAERVMVQKSGYFSRAAPANQSDLDLIRSACALAVDCAMRGESGVIGHDEDHQNIMRAIEFERIKGGKPFNVQQAWFREMMAEINCPVRLDQPVRTFIPCPYQPKLMAGLQLPKKVAILTAGGLAPGMSSAVGGLIERYNELVPNVEIIYYANGFRGLLQGQSIRVSSEARRDVGFCHAHGGSPFGNSRVNLNNAEDCVKKGLTNVGEDPYAKAVAQLSADGVDVLHPIGGDTVGVRLARHLEEKGQSLRIIGLAKTIDNDVTPIRQTLGAWTAAETAARYFANVVCESTANPRMLIIHEIMGASCGYLTAATADIYRGLMQSKGYVPGIGLNRAKFDVHAVFIPEIPLDIHAEAERLRRVMETEDCVNIFVSEGAGIEAVAAEMEKKGQQIPRDDNGKVKFGALNVGDWFSKQFAAMIGAEKVLVQKSGYYARSSAANSEDLRLIKSCTDHAVECALRGESGIVGHDEEQFNVLRAIEFDRIKGEKPFKTTQPWFQDLLSKIGQKMEYAPGARQIDVTEEAMNNVKVRYSVEVVSNRNRVTALYK
jgi:pyrophosphate--fructose-6-phosphate 1-phosphotransferase